MQLATRAHLVAEGIELAFDRARARFRNYTAKELTVHILM